jgi:hypothetical protein
MQKRHLHSLQHYIDVLLSRKTKIGMAVIHTDIKVENKFHNDRIYTKLGATV